MCQFILSKKAFVYELASGPFAEDFGLRLGPDVRPGLIVSERALGVLREHNLDFVETSEA